jgi:hypothetical protein
MKEFSVCVNVREDELKVVDINSRVNDYQIKWLQHPGIVEQNRFPKLTSDYKPRGRRVQSCPCKTWREHF